MRRCASNNALKRFNLAFTPQHSGALSVNYSFDPSRFGTVKIHMDMSSTDQYAYTPFGEQRANTYTLFNARLTLTDIPLGKDLGTLSTVIWARNITDKEYIINAFPVSDPAVSIGYAFGDPMTAGVSFTYTY